MNATRYLCLILRQPEGDWKLDVQQSQSENEIVKASRTIFHERTRRTYSSPGEAAVGLRHLVNELEREKPKPHTLLLPLMSGTLENAKP